MLKIWALIVIILTTIGTVSNNADKHSKSYKPATIIIVTGIVALVQGW